MSIIADAANRVYEPLAYRLEADFEKQVVALADHIFGRQSIYPDFGVASQDLPTIIPPAREFSPVFSSSISNCPEQ